MMSVGLRMVLAQIDGLAAGDMPHDDDVNPHSILESIRIMLQ